MYSWEKRSFGRFLEINKIVYHMQILEIFYGVNSSKLYELYFGNFVIY